LRVVILRVVAQECRPSNQDRPIGAGLLPLKAPKAFLFKWGEGLAM